MDGEPESGSRLPAVVARFVAEHGIDGTVVAAVSGGPDSVALLHALHGEGVAVHVAHLHHGLRGAAADADAGFVAELAGELGLLATVGGAELGGGPGLEERARVARREFLADVAAECGASWIALGHTADDQAETVLHHVLRGTGLRGLAGMRPVHGAFVRPLLAVRRAEVLAFLAATGAPYRVDATNADQEFTRNRIRHDLLPRLAAEYNPQVVDALNRLAALAADADEWVAAEVAELHGRVVSRTGGGLALDVAALAAAPRYLRLALLREVIGEAGGGAAGVTLEHAVAAGELVGAQGTAVTLPGGVVARRRGGVLRLGHEPAGTAERWEVDAALPGTTLLAPAGVTLALARVAPPGDADTPPGEAYLDADRLHLPLAVRNRRPGDRFRGLGAPGSQKLKQFLADRKIPAEESDRLPLLVDQEGIVCVLGHRIADRVKVTPATTACAHVVIDELDSPPSPSLRSGASPA